RARAEARGVVAAQHDADREPLLQRNAPAPAGVEAADEHLAGRVVPGEVLEVGEVRHVLARAESGADVQGARAEPGAPGRVGDEMNDTPGFTRLKLAVSSSRPSRWRIGMTAGTRDSPTSSSGRRPSSKSVTRAPWRASRIASAEPEGPAPTIATLIDGFYRSESWGRRPRP